MELDKKSLEKLKTTVEKCIAELAERPTLTPAETKAALDGMELRDWICCEIGCQEDEEQMKKSQNGYSGNYSGHHQPYRRYSITAYGRPMEYQMDPRAYEGPNGNYSGDYGVEGWYRSGTGKRHMSYCAPWDEYGYEPYYGRMDEAHRYSRHSVADRIVSLIEHNVMNGDNSEYENEEAKKFIRMIRQAEMG